MATGVTTRHWALALAAGVAVALAPPAYARFPARDSVHPPRQTIALALRSAVVPHAGLAESTGTLGLPDLPRLGDVAALLGATTRTRVWWQSPDAWRVDRVTPTGESGTYAIPGGVQTWDFESGAVRRELGATPVRLPRFDDLLPPQAARRVLSGVTARDRVQSLPARRIAGRDAEGVRIAPTDRRTTVGHLDMYVDEATGLPLSLVVVPRGDEVAALRTAFVSVSFDRPAAGTLRPTVAPFARVRTIRTPDLAAAVDRFAPFDLPGSLAGLRRGKGLLGSGGGTATYGTGVTRFVVLPLWSRLGRAAADAASGGGGSPVDVGTAGEAVLVSTPLLNAIVAQSGPGQGPDSRAYLLAGSVLPGVLQTAATELLSDPPPLR